MAATPITPLFILSLFFMLNFLPIPSFSCPLHQKEALLHFKSTITTIFDTNLGHEYANPFESWNPNSDCCSWERVSCSETQSVTNLYLQYLDHGFSRAVLVPSDILTPLFHIQSMKQLVMSYSGFVGEIPGDGFGNLTNLVHLNMMGNNFNGSIPSQLFDLIFLQYLVLTDNNLHGVLSPEVGKLQNLELFYLNRNYFSGNIPENIGNLTKLREFSLTQNLFSGEIPSSIVNMKELEYLDLTGNSFSGQIPDALGRLPNMAYLYLNKNQFVGPIPSSIQNMTKLNDLMLRNNNLAGEVPTWLFEISTLKNLLIGGRGSNLTWNNKAKIVPKCKLIQMSMTFCGISGQIPQWLSSQKELLLLDLSGNKLEGRFPDWLIEIDLQVILIFDNMLSGSIPPILFDSKHLTILGLANNNFSGELPENIDNATSMEVLMLLGNNVSGQIPMSMWNLSNLNILDLARNKFFGDIFPIRRDLGMRLSYLDLSYNEFSGKILINFFKDIQNIFLGRNKFSGNLPWNLSKLDNLQHLDLHNNCLTGNLRDIIPQIPNLQVLNLRNNSFEGFIPTTISKLTSLQILDLSRNNLTGSIPQEIANLRSMIETPQMSIFNRIAYGSKLGEYEIAYKIQDLIVNWKNSLRALSSQNLDIYSFLDLSDNRISGEIPTTLGNLKGLKVLNISHNNIFGHIPVSFGNLMGMESLDLSHNKLSGLIPQSLAKMNELTLLDVSNNRLRGRIPSGGQMNTFNELKYFANNSGPCGLQIRIVCPEDIPPSDVMEEEHEQQPWIMWEGSWIGFLVRFFSSILMMGYSLNLIQ